MNIAPTSLHNIAQICDGKVLGDATLIVSNVSALHNANAASLSLFTGVFDYLQKLQETPALACFVKECDLAKMPKNVTPIVVKDPYLAIAQIIHKLIGDGEQYPTEFLSNEEKPNDISIFATVAKCAKIGKNVKILPNVYIGCNVEIQDNVTIHAGACLEHCFIGKNSIIRTGAKIGTMGFGFVPNFQNGQHLLVPQIAKVIVEEGVDIGANTCVDRGFLSNTVIGAYTKIDNLCHIAHGVEIGKSCFLAGCTGIAGGAKIGNFCMIGGNSSIAGNITIADYTQIYGMSGVASNVEIPKQTIAGIPAVASTKWKKMHIKALQSITKHTS